MRGGGGAGRRRKSKVKQSVIRGSRAQAEKTPRDRGRKDDFGKDEKKNTRKETEREGMGKRKREKKLRMQAID